MESEYLFHYGKPQTASFSGADIVSAGLIVAIPYVRKLVLSYTRTVIGNFDSVSLSGPPYAEDYDFVFSAVLYGIVDQIGYDLLDLVFVSVSKTLFGRIEDELVSFLFRQDVVRREDSGRAAPRSNMDLSRITL